MDTLRTLADNTDGRAIVNRNDLAAGMKQIVRDTSAYYLLGYNSTHTATDGKFHEIKVRVKRPGIQVRARKGYWAFQWTTPSGPWRRRSPGSPRPWKTRLPQSRRPPGRDSCGPGSARSVARPERRR